MHLHLECFWWLVVMGVLFIAFHSSKSIDVDLVLLTLVKRTIKGTLAKLPEHQHPSRDGQTLSRSKIASRLDGLHRFRVANGRETEKRPLKKPAHFELTLSESCTQKHTLLVSMELT